MPPREYYLFPSVNKIARLGYYLRKYTFLASKFQSLGDRENYLEYLGHQRRVYIELQCMKGALRLQKAKIKAPTAGKQLMLKAW